MSNVISINRKRQPPTKSKQLVAQDAFLGKHLKESEVILLTDSIEYKPGVWKTTIKVSWGQYETVYEQFSNKDDIEFSMKIWKATALFNLQLKLDNLGMLKFSSNEDIKPEYKNGWFRTVFG